MDKGDENVMSLKDELRKAVEKSKETNNTLAGKSIFLSGSVPSVERENVYFKGSEPEEISNAIVELARAVFQAGGALVFGGHPEVAPMIRSIAEEGGFGSLENNAPSIYIYQSDVFSKEQQKEAIKLNRFEFVELVSVARKKGERPKFTAKKTLNPTSVEGSLTKMRSVMTSRPDLVGAVFVGGMGGCLEEYELSAKLRRYLVCKPGGAARVMSKKRSVAPDDAIDNLADDLKGSRLYPSMMRKVVEDCVQSSDR